MTALALPVLNLSRIFDLFQPKPRTVCAWCLKEKGIKPSANDSHGICRKHAEQMRRELGILPGGGK